MYFISGGGRGGPGSMRGGGRGGAGPPMRGSRGGPMRGRGGMDRRPAPYQRP